MKISDKIATAGLSTLGIILVVLLILLLFGGYGFGGGYIRPGRTDSNHPCDPASDRKTLIAREGKAVLPRMIACYISGDYSSGPRNDADLVESANRSQSVHTRFKGFNS